MRLHRNLIVLLVSVVFVGACGSGQSDEAGNDSGSGNGSATTAADDGSSSDSGNASGSGSGSGSGGGGDNGSIQFEISGNWEGGGELVFIPEASSYFQDNWSLSFAVNREGSGDQVIIINLNPEILSVTYGDPEVTFTGGADNCVFDIDSQSVNGASGSIECTNLFAIAAESSMRDGVNFSATFDARS